jgi:RsiW-degrading membrane proteinase PrsW (M82 family)
MIEVSAWIFYPVMFTCVSFVMIILITLAAYCIEGREYYDNIIDFYKELFEGEDGARTIYLILSLCIFGGLLLAFITKVSFHPIFKVI